MINDDPGRARAMAAVGLRADAACAAVPQANRASWRALERAGFARLWAGQLDSDAPSAAGPVYVYVTAAGRP